MLIERGKLKSSMPDVAAQKTKDSDSDLDFVGMESVDLPLMYLDQQTSAKASLFVNLLKGNSRGIHMSRLYLALGDSLTNQNLSWKLLKKILRDFRDSQNKISNKSKIILSWQQLIKRAALLSDNKGWKAYPVKVYASLNKEDSFDIKLKFSIFYSSTCPCSAALSRQLKQDRFLHKFQKENVSKAEVHQWLGDEQVAAPHSQRSRADIIFTLADSVTELDLVKYIDALEGVLKTPVQTAVKRVDEQEFARLNGENLMFVEDALRKMKQTIKTFNEVKKFKITTRHFESLHPHNAMGVVFG